MGSRWISSASEEQEKRDSENTSESENGKKSDDGNDKVIVTRVKRNLIRKVYNESDDDFGAFDTKNSIRSMQKIKSSESESRLLGAQSITRFFSKKAERGGPSAEELKENEMRRVKMEKKMQGKLKQIEKQSSKKPVTIKQSQRSGREWPRVTKGRKSYIEDDSDDESESVSESEAETVCAEGEYEDESGSQTDKNASEASGSGPKSAKKKVNNTKSTAHEGHERPKRENRSESESEQKLTSIRKSVRRPTVSALKAARGNENWSESEDEYEIVVGNETGSESGSEGKGKRMSKRVRAAENTTKTTNYMEVSSSEDEANQTDAGSNRSTIGRKGRNTADVSFSKMIGDLKFQRQSKFSKAQGQKRKTVIDSQNGRNSEIRVDSGESESESGHGTESEIESQSSDKEETHKRIISRQREGPSKTKNTTSKSSKSRAKKSNPTMSNAKFSQSGRVKVQSRKNESSSSDDSEGYFETPEKWYDFITEAPNVLPSMMPLAELTIEKLLNVKVEDDKKKILVKFRGVAYKHARWVDRSTLLKTIKGAPARVRNFESVPVEEHFFDLDEPFNPDYTQINRIIMEHSANKTNGSKWYLVMWRNMGYEDCTWEDGADLTDSDSLAAVAKFKRREIAPKRKFNSPKMFQGAHRTHTFKTLTESPNTFLPGHTLLDYQLEGLNWMVFQWHQKRNCLLADEMGLGKTVQSVAFIHHLGNTLNLPGPFLVIAPLSTIGHWLREFEEWTDMNVIVMKGKSEGRKVLKETELYRQKIDGKLDKTVFKFQVMITTYEYAMMEGPVLSKIHWTTCVLDEAHRLKNIDCKLQNQLRQFKFLHQVLLTGTPLQNNLEEVWSLLNYMDTEKFPDLDDFIKDFGMMQSEEDVNRLQKLLKVYMLRRMKSDVQKNILPKQETIIQVELTSIQKRYYRAILERNLKVLAQGTTMPSLNNISMELRKCCIHPYLITGCEENVLKEEKCDNDEKMNHALIHASGKMVLVDKLLKKLKAGGHKVLIFSQMTRCLDILSDYLDYASYQYERIDGTTSGEARQQSIDRFSKPGSDKFVFLLSTKAGGMGINLTAADTCIIYDSDWNPQNDVQAQARCHRIGQKSTVQIYRLITHNTYEEEMFKKASMKLGLEKAILGYMNRDKDDNKQKSSAKDMIEELVKKGAYGSLMDADDTEASTFCAETIEDILERRSKVVTLDDENEPGSSFSKAVFEVKDNVSDLNIDDPDFWTKWGERANLDVVALMRESENENIVVGSRVRKKTKHFGMQSSAKIKKSKARAHSSEEKSDSDADDFESSDGLSTDDFSTTTGESESGSRGRRKRSKQNCQITNDKEAIEFEKVLTSFGWGRWMDIRKASPKTCEGLTDYEVQALAKEIVLMYVQSESVCNEPLFVQFAKHLCDTCPAQPMPDSDLSINMIKTGTDITLETNGSVITSVSTPTTECNIKADDKNSTIISTGDGGEAVQSSVSDKNVADFRTPPPQLAWILAHTPQTPGAVVVRQAGYFRKRAKVGNIAIKLFNKLHLLVWYNSTLVGPKLLNEGPVESISQPEVRHFNPSTSNTEECVFAKEWWESSTYNLRVGLIAMSRHGYGYTKQIVTDILNDPNLGKALASLVAEIQNNVEGDPTTDEFKRLALQARQDLHSELVVILKETLSTSGKAHNKRFLQDKRDIKAKASGTAKDNRKARDELARIAAAQLVRERAPMNPDIWKTKAQRSFERAVLSYGIPSSETCATVDTFCFTELNPVGVDSNASANITLSTIKASTPDTKAYTTVNNNTIIETVSQTDDFSLPISSAKVSEYEPTPVSTKMKPNAPSTYVNDKTVVENPNIGEANHRVKGLKGGSKSNNDPASEHVEKVSNRRCPAKVTRSWAQWKRVADLENVPDAMLDAFWVEFRAMLLCAVAEEENNGNPANTQVKPSISAPGGCLMSVYTGSTSDGKHSSVSDTIEPTTSTGSTPASKTVECENQNGTGGLQLKHKLNGEKIFPGRFGIHKITAFRARLCLDRVDLMDKLRTVVLKHSKLLHTIKRMPSQTLKKYPTWWQKGIDDVVLLKAIEQHGFDVNSTVVVKSCTDAFINGRELLQDLKKTSPHLSDSLVMQLWSKIGWPKHGDIIRRLKLIINHVQLVESTLHRDGRIKPVFTTDVDGTSSKQKRKQSCLMFQTVSSSKSSQGDSTTCADTSDDDFIAFKIMKKHGLAKMSARSSPTQPINEPTSLVPESRSNLILNKRPKPRPASIANSRPRMYKSSFTSTLRSASASPQRFKTLNPNNSPSNSPSLAPKDSSSSTPTSTNPKTVALNTNLRSIDESSPISMPTSSISSPDSQTAVTSHKRSHLSDESSTTGTANEVINWTSGPLKRSKVAQTSLLSLFQKKSESQVATSQVVTSADLDSAYTAMIDVDNEERPISCAT
eukprot:CFRG6977T1